MKPAQSIDLQEAIKLADPSFHVDCAVYDLHPPLRVHVKVGAAGGRLHKHGENGVEKRVAIAGNGWQKESGRGERWGWVLDKR